MSKNHYRVYLSDLTEIDVWADNFVQRTVDGRQVFTFLDIPEYNIVREIPYVYVEEVHRVIVSRTHGLKKM